MNDYWADGHYVSATDETDARAEVRALYGHEATEVRPWAEED